MDTLKIAREGLNNPKARPGINALVRAALQRANHESVAINDARQGQPSLLDVAVAAGLVEITEL